MVWYSVVQMDEKLAWKWAESSVVMKVVMMELPMVMRMGLKMVA